MAGMDGRTLVCSAVVPNVKFHDLRRTAVRNMRRARVSQVVRMRITGHRTDSMERRYNIVDVDDIKTAKSLMEKRPQKKDRNYPLIFLPLIHTRSN
jgi:integrase